MVICPSCGLLLQTLDLPCPGCSDPVEGLPPGVASTLHEYSKTFTARHLVRPNVDRTLDEINAWLATQPGLRDAWPTVHRGYGAEVRAVTMTCLASSEPVAETMSLHRIAMARGSVAWGSKDLGLALNEWAEQHPDLLRVRHGVRSHAGIDMECWVVASGPYRPAYIAPVVGSVWQRGLLTVLRVAPILFACSALLSLVAVAGALAGNGYWALPTVVSILLLAASIGSAMGARSLASRGQTHT